MKARNLVQCNLITVLDLVGDTDGSERRLPRRRVLQTAVVAYADLSVSFRCTIRDRSDTGARLKLPAGILPPPQFWMIEVATGVAYAANTVWRRYPEIGVGLADPIDLKIAPQDSTQRYLKGLWAVVAP